nr:hypothetical protein [uncultured bacterium]
MPIIRTLKEAKGDEAFEEDLKAKQRPISPGQLKESLSETEEKGSVSVDAANVGIELPISIWKKWWSFIKS